MGYLLLVLALSLNAAANVLMKLGADQLPAWGDPGMVKSLLGNPYLITGVFLFALNVAFYVSALTRLNLSVAYPVMMAGGVLVVLCISILLLREPFTMLQLVGSACLVSGIVLVTAGATA